jgi:T5SS/PEP-CTERM-associated repeat protein
VNLFISSSSFSGRKALFTGSAGLFALVLAWSRAEASVDYGGTGDYQSPPYSALYIGYNGQGTLDINTLTSPNTSTTLTSPDVYLGYNATDSGVVTVDGIGASWTITGTLRNGGSGSGTINVINGGVVNDNGSNAWQTASTTNPTLSISTGGQFIAASSIQTLRSTLSVDGAGSILSGTSVLLDESNSETGSLAITNGGTVTLQNLGLTEDGASASTLTINGGTLNLTSGLTLGGVDSSAQITGGARINSSGDIIRSATAASTTTVLVSGAGTKWSTGSLNVGDSNVGHAIVTVADQAVLQATANIDLGNSTDGSTGGTLQIGNGAAPGIINAPSVTGSLNTGTGEAGSAVVEFDHNANDYYFTTTGTSSGTGVAIQNQAQVQVVSGTTIFTSTNNNYSRGTLITGGTLLVDNTSGAGTGIGDVTVGAAGTLGGTGIINPTGASVVSISGTLAPGDTGTIGKLTINSSGNTAAHVLSLNSGAALQFNLGAGLTSANLTLTNAVAGALVFNNNVINFNDLTAGNLAAGTYQLITATDASDYSGLTYDPNGLITSGLTIGTGLGNDSASLSLVGNNIDLTLAVPEPSFWALMGMGLFTVLLQSRIRRKSRPKLPAFI